MTSSTPNTTPTLKVPQGNDNVLEKAAAPIATLSSHADPWPHYIMTGACEWGAPGWRHCTWASAEAGCCCTEAVTVD